ncbi:MAG: ATP-binding protein [Magnetococcales bacterium]|nr:ATP-binding protein [Magnetococcales bacterium]
MLVEFSVTNYLTFCERQTLSLTAASQIRERSGNSFDTGIKRLPKLNRATVVYGPNASGKSNLVRALKFMRDFVLNCAQGQSGEPIPVQAFELNSRTRTAPSLFEVVIVQKGIRYQYGFAVNKQRVCHEWLLAYPQGRPQRWFERHLDSATGEEQWHLHKKMLPASSGIWKDFTRDNALFLSTAVQLNAQVLKPVFDWFSKSLTVLPPHAEVSVDHAAKLVQDPEGRQRILSFLNQADLQVDGIHVETRTATDKADGEENAHLMNTLQSLLKKKLDGWNWQITDITLERRSVDTNHMVRLPWNTESQGTRKLFALAGPWLDLMAQDRVLVIDELDTSLHHALVRHLFAALHKLSGDTHSQLVCTTHDTALLDDKSFRRDQFWMVERTVQRCSHLYPVSEYRVSLSEPLQKRYLDGHYGGVPDLKKSK